MRAHALAVPLLVLPLLAASEPSRVREAHFASGWHRVPAEEAPRAPASVPAPPPRDGEDVPEAEHALAAHVHITRQAAALFLARHPGAELGRHLDAVLEGAVEEDSPYKNAFGEAVSVLRHFWHWRGGLRKGLWGHDSSVNRAQKYWTGGYGLDGKLDPDWKDPAGDGVLGLYRKGDKAKAYRYLGHVAHLLEDLTVPAHNLLWPHPAAGLDAYETFMKERHADWSARPGAAAQDFASLRELFSRTALVAEGFDAGSGPGAKGVDGSADKGRRRADGFTEAELRAEGDVLMPLAFSRVDALFELFERAR